MRWLLALVSVMGVLIVAGVATVAVTIIGRLGALPPAVPAQLVLDEPAGTRITGIAALGDRLALSLAGGGPDRILILDPRHPSAASHISLSH